MKEEKEIITNKEEARISDTIIEISRSILNMGKNDPPIQYLSLEVYQRCDATNTTTIKINLVQKDEVLDFAKKLQTIAESFQD